MKKELILTTTMTNQVYCRLPLTIHLNMNHPYI